ncbi:WD40-repeat-containing domain protein [Suillus clintonianus]|uniref:WD40-repeat-containing domain protein n=1 Tax=Suillus clintonianus TaxID=1904413 RepID=UPI001B87312B|nr:WD40-repeat-containing domain protein [Suillus clintonianus]KAG2134537.1 WD40-repeat-containing domain protein [Suillus clintonianus]
MEPPAPTMSSSTRKTPATTPRQTMQGHTDWVTGVVHLPSGRRIITCSADGSLRLWDLERGAQIGEDWREDGLGMRSMALSPNHKTVASGSDNGTVRLWDVETRKVISKWTGHAKVVCALCWSADGERVASGSWDGTARVWDVESGKTILKIKTGHEWAIAVMYSPDNEYIATGGDNKDAVKIWNAKTGKLTTTLKHDNYVRSLTWTSDGKKLISGSYNPIRIFDTATWQQIAILEGHTHGVRALSLSPNNRLLASVSYDKTARLWNLDTNLPIGSPLQHEDGLESAALSADGTVLVTGCKNGNVYTWDIHAILKESGLEDLLSTGTNNAPNDGLEQKASQGKLAIERTPRSSLSDKSFLEADATRCHNESGGHVDDLPPGFFDSMEAEVHPSQTGGAHPHSYASALLARLSSLLYRFRHDNDEATEFPQPPTPSRLHLHVLLARLSSLIHRSPPEINENDAAGELQPPSTPSRLDPHALLARLSSLLPRSRLNTEEETEPHPTTHSGSRSSTLIDRLSSLFHTGEATEPQQPPTPSGSRAGAIISSFSSLFRSSPNADEVVELQQWPRQITSSHCSPHVVEVAAQRDKKALYVARRPKTASENAKRIKNPKPWERLNELTLFILDRFTVILGFLKTQKMSTASSGGYSIG